MIYIYLSDATGSIRASNLMSTSPIGLLIIHPATTSNKRIRTIVKRKWDCKGNRKTRIGLQIQSRNSNGIAIPIVKHEWDCNYDRKNIEQLSLRTRAAGYSYSCRQLVCVCESWAASRFFLHKWWMAFFLLFAVGRVWERFRKKGNGPFFFRHRQKFARKKYF